MANRGLKMADTGRPGLVMLRMSEVREEGGRISKVVNTWQKAKTGEKMAGSSDPHEKVARTGLAIKKTLSKRERAEHFK